MENFIDDYNLGLVEEVEEDGLIIKPLIVIDKSSYDEFKVTLDKDSVKLYKDEFESGDGVFILPYDTNKNLIAIS